MPCSREASVSSSHSASSAVRFVGDRVLGGGRVVVVDDHRGDLGPAERPGRADGAVAGADDHAVLLHDDRLALAELGEARLDRLEVPLAVEAGVGWVEVERVERDGEEAEGVGDHGAMVARAGGGAGRLAGAGPPECVGQVGRDSAFQDVPQSRRPAALDRSVPRGP
ncbi:MAG: hypothetical protein MUC36_24190, partial [Planctomycetes bacterium]|nr:hypothetical protein [Planctomycetota bacterium]